MNIEEKAKRYDEAIKRAKTYYNTTDSVADTELLELIFPELKESEDEKIRKAVIGAVETLPDSPLKVKMLAWIEKQGEQTEIYKGRNYRCIKTHNYAGVEWREGIKYYANEDFELVNEGCTYYCPKYSKEEHNKLFEEVGKIGCVEKQGEQKHETPIPGLTLVIG